MPEARLRLDKLLSHLCPLGPLATEDHRNGRGNRGGFGETGCLELAILPDGKCPVGKPFSADG